MAPIVRRAAPIDAPRMTDTMQQAFYDDPLMAYLFPDAAGRRWRMAKMFELTIEHHHLPLRAAWTTADYAGVALWAPPGYWHAAQAHPWRDAAIMTWVLGRRLGRAARTLSAVVRAHPSEPHWYLAGLGTAPRFQRRGIGSALLQPVLAVCDDEGLPAYLESSNRDNVPFYRRHGFDVTGELPLPNGPTLWPMYRRPR